MGCKGSRVWRTGEEDNRRDYFMVGARTPSECPTAEQKGIRSCEPIGVVSRRSRGSSQCRFTRRNKRSHQPTVVSPQKSQRTEEISAQASRPYNMRKRRPMEKNKNRNHYNNCCDENDGTEYYMPLDSGSSSSIPQLFRIAMPEQAHQGVGTWEWWYKQIERFLITKDCTRRKQLQDIPNRLMRQFDTDKESVQLDFGWCYMERSAPYVLGRLLASPFLGELRWVSALRFDGNYFTHDGFGNMLSVMSEANEKMTVLPLLKQLYLNSMNLDHCSVHGVLFYLFPLDISVTTTVAWSQTIPEERVVFPPKAYIPFNKLPRSALFPSLEILSLCDNPGIGNCGLARVLRWLLAPHFERRSLSVLDLSRCGIDEAGVRYIREYSAHLKNIKDNEKVVVSKRIVLFGNRHSS